MPIVKRLMWGEYFMKPVAQVDFENKVRQAVEAIAAADGDQDFRPRLKCLNTKMHFLIDTGAAISVYPCRLCPNAKEDFKKGLQAINGSKIKTFGNKTIKIRPDKKSLRAQPSD